MRRLRTGPTSTRRHETTISQSDFFRRGKCDTSLGWAGGRGKRERRRTWTGVRSTSRDLNRRVCLTTPVGTPGPRTLSLSPAPLLITFSSRGLYEPKEVGSSRIRTCLDSPTRELCFVRGLHQSKRGLDINS